MEEILSPLSSKALEQFRVTHGKKKRSRNVCACGHSENAHYVVGADVSCTPGKMLCGCKELRPVLVADNLRMFMFSTTGKGADHALGKGILSCVDKGFTFEWLAEPLCCDFCETVVEEPIPVSTDLVRKMPLDYDGSVNKIVCPTCYGKWVGASSV